ncbi:hypothetical protein TanjilG_06688 [Lupinus angustifolius]|uniref:Ethylene insensitive 3-like DNA-binding domain-containing protein n=1 Tax=Lupinus angustifolius TaxID=3871 RepID=A0A1J7I081_LUPAN|nr:hypothetical protein TanjilG_06688 [Lupinus angustifolius]
MEPIFNNFSFSSKERNGNVGLTVDELEERIRNDRKLLKQLKGEAVENEEVHLSEQCKREIMSDAQNGILKHMIKLMEVCNAQGFVYGIVPDNGKPIIGASENLRQWWKEKVKFDRNGPAAVAKYEAENGKNVTMNGGNIDPADMFDEISDFDVEFTNDGAKFQNLEEHKELDNANMVQMEANISENSTVIRPTANKRARKLSEDIYTYGNLSQPYNNYHLGLSDITTRSSHQLNHSNGNNTFQMPKLSNLQDDHILKPTENGMNMVQDIMSSYNKSIQENNIMASWNMMPPMNHNQHQQSLKLQMDMNIFSPEINDSSDSRNSYSEVTRYPAAPCIGPEVNPITSQFDSTCFNQIFIGSTMKQGSSESFSTRYN